jgi:hypothetical protein
MALTTLSGVNAYKGWTTGSDTTRDAQVTTMIDGISTRFETYCDRKFNSATYTQYYDSDGSTHLYLDQYPITTISGIWNDTAWTWDSTTLISGTTYRIVDNQGVVFRYGPASGSQSIKITYTAGYTTIPDDLVEACSQEVSDLWKDSTKSTGTLKSKTLPDGSVTYGEGGGSTNTTPFRATTMDILNRYRNKHIV